MLQLLLGTSQSMNMDKGNQDQQMKTDQNTIVLAEPQFWDVNFTLYTGEKSGMQEV